MARFQRDPLSEGYDGAARDVVSRAVRAYSRSPVKARPLWVRGHQDLIHGTGEDRGGRTRDERAFTRALYHEPRIHQMSKDKPEAVWSLRIEWLGREGGRSAFRVRVFPDTSGARHARNLRGGKHSTRSYARNPGLRSGADGSGQERFPA